MAPSSPKKSSPSKEEPFKGMPADSSTPEKGTNPEESPKTRASKKNPEASDVSPKTASNEAPEPSIEPATTPEDGQAPAEETKPPPNDESSKGGAAPSNEETSGTTPPKQVEATVTSASSPFTNKPLEGFPENMLPPYGPPPYGWYDQYPPSPYGYYPPPPPGYWPPPPRNMMMIPPSGGGPTEPYAFRPPAPASPPDPALAFRPPVPQSQRSASAGKTKETTVHPSTSVSSSPTAAEEESPPHTFRPVYYVKPKPPVNGELAERRSRKNALSRARSANVKERVKRIEDKPASERTEEERELLYKFLEARDRKNQRSKDRALEKKREIERILSKPEMKRTKTEIKFLQVYCNAKAKKNEGDRKRRQMIKELKKPPQAHSGAAPSQQPAPFYPPPVFYPPPPPVMGQYPSQEMRTVTPKTQEPEEIMPEEV